MKKDHTQGAVKINLVSVLKGIYEFYLIKSGKKERGEG